MNGFVGGFVWYRTGAVGRAAHFPGYGLAAAGTAQIVSRRSHRPGVKYGHRFALESDLDLSPSTPFTVNWLYRSIRCWYIAKKAFQLRLSYFCFKCLDH